MVDALPEHSRLASIADIKREIAAGTYETPERLAAAVEAMLSAELGEDGKSADNRPVKPK